MCGILAVFSNSRQAVKPRKYRSCRLQSLREISFQQSRNQRHRGPDDTGVVNVEQDGVVLVHERLSIIGVHTGHQPLKSSDGSVMLIVNGEIYNYLELAAEIANKRSDYTPKSDSNVIVEMYEEHGVGLLKHITGMFAFVLYDTKKQFILMARDPFGIIPMYRGQDQEGNTWVASELKCLVDVCSKVESVEPGTMIYGQANNLKSEVYYQPAWLRKPLSQPTDLRMLCQKLEEAVRSHLQADVEVGALLSGGIDSSLIAAIATKIIRERKPNYRLKTYSIGLKGAPDFKYSRMVADFIGSDHSEVIFTVEEGLDYIRDVIYSLETYDTTTVRCSIPMYLLARYIKGEGIKVILSGEGSDEIFGGYLYFFKAPNPKEFHHELVSRIQKLHLTDCLRANKASMSWGLELRVPFLDTAFVNHVMSIKPEEKIPGIHNTFQGEVEKQATNSSSTSKMEKYILRCAFANNYIPDEVIWRQKEQFSDGVGYSWNDSIRRYATAQVTDEEFAKAAETFPINTPKTKEAFYYRAIFEEMFPGEHCARTVKYWTPRTDWGCPEEPSGRAQSVHQEHQ